MEDQAVSRQDQVKSTRTSDNLETVAHAFVHAHQQTPEAFFAYVNQLAGLIREESKNVNRSAGLIFVLVFFFHLFSSTGITEAEIFAVKVSDFSLVLLAIPIVITILFARVTSISVRRGALSNMYGAIIGARFKDDADNIYPAYDALASVGDAAVLLHALPESLIKGKQSNRVHGLLTTADVILVALTPPVILTYLYWRIFVKFGVSNALAWGSLAIASLILVLAYGFIFIEVKE